MPSVHDFDPDAYGPLDEDDEDALRRHFDDVESVPDLPSGEGINAIKQRWRLADYGVPAHVIDKLSDKQRQQMLRALSTTRGRRLLTDALPMRNVDDLT